MPLHPQREKNQVGSFYLMLLPQTQWKQTSERWQERRRRKAGGEWEQTSHPCGSHHRPLAQRARHGTAQSPRHVSALRGTPPQVQLCFFIPKPQLPPAPPRLGDAASIARQSTLQWGPSNPKCHRCMEVPPRTARQAFFFSLPRFSVTSYHAPFPAIPWCDNTMLWFVSFEVSKYIDALANQRLLQADRHDFPAEITALHPLPPMADVWLWRQTLQQALKAESFHLCYFLKQLETTRLLLGIHTLKIPSIPFFVRLLKITIPCFLEPLHKNSPMFVAHNACIIRKESDKAPICLG